MRGADPPTAYPDRFFAAQISQPWSETQDRMRVSFPVVYGLLFTLSIGVGSNKQSQPWPLEILECDLALSEAARERRRSLAAACAGWG